MGIYSVINNLDDKELEYDFTQEKKITLIIRIQIRTRPIQNKISPMKYILRLLQIIPNNPILHIQILSKLYKSLLRIFLEKLNRISKIGKIFPPRQMDRCIFFWKMKQKEFWRTFECLQRCNSVFLLELK